MNKAKRDNYIKMNHIKKGNKDGIQNQFFVAPRLVHRNKIEAKIRKRKYQSKTYIKFLGGSKLTSAVSKTGYIKKPSRKMFPFTYHHVIGNLLPEEQNSEAITKARFMVRALGTIFPRIKKRIGIKRIPMDENIMDSFYNADLHIIKIGAARSHVNNAGAIAHEATHALMEKKHPGSYEREWDKLEQSLAQRAIETRIPYNTVSEFRKHVYNLHPEENLAKKIEQKSENVVKKLMTTKRRIHKMSQILGKSFTNRLVLQAKQSRRK